MEKVIIQSHDLHQAKKARELTKIYGCRVISTRVPDDNKKGIEQSFSCPRGVSDEIIKKIKEPNLLERLIPDKIKSIRSEYDVKKPRIIDF